MGRISALTLLYNANLKKKTIQAMFMPSVLVTLSSSTLSRVPFTGTSNGSFGRWGHQKEATPYQGGTPGLEIGDSSLSHPEAGTHRFMSPSDFAQDTDYENPEGNSN